MKMLISGFLGIMTWPLLEYLLHRFLGHDLKLNTLFKKEHTRHHSETDYFAPLSYKAAAAVPICTITVLLVRLMTGSWEIAIAYTVGFIAMFSIYELVHWNMHATAPSTKLGMRLRKHHLAHHFHNPKMNHGVTTTIIDKLAGTYLPVTVVKIPKKINLPWLYEAGKETIDPKFSNDFQMR
jgi:sterol desaturase/sphingolipid hydroxylase (fatty acid hydroxylase superfamily)